ncbi:MAG: hypothetical protein QXK18_04825 [Candidatus Bathyarchaeia archaeon]
MANLILTGNCKCGKYFSVAVELPEFITVRSGNNVYNARLGEHLVVQCPACGRILNMGNGSRRSRKTEEKNP